MHIGILQTGHAPDALRPVTGDYDQFFERLLSGRGFRFSTWNVVDMEFPPGPEAADGWLITGSRHGAYEDLPFIAPLSDFLRRAYAAEVPIVGICFGHQILAQALGGKVEKFPGGWVVGRQVYDWQGRDVALMAWHQDQVTEAPAEAEVIAQSPTCAHAALLYGRRALTIQAHPEYDAGFIAGLMEHRGVAVPEDRLEAARIGLQTPIQAEEVAGMMARFLEERRI